MRNPILIAISCTTLAFSSCSKEETKASTEHSKTLKSDVLEDIEWAIGWMEDGITYQFLIDENGELEVTELGGPPTPPRQEIGCSSDGYSFANCIKDYLNAHPRHCLKIWKDGDEYFADNDQ